MKIAVDCNSLLMRKSLELFLTKYLTTSKNADIVITDTKRDDGKAFFISTNKDEADLVKPFTKAQLILALERRFKNSKTVVSTNNENELDFSILERRIDFLTQEYKNNILKAVKAFYEK